MKAALTRILKALANPRRREIFRLICRRAGRRGLTVGAVSRMARMKQPAVSHHVARLAAAGLVLRRKRGWNVLCSPSREALEVLRRFARDPGGRPPK